VRRRLGQEITAHLVSAFVLLRLDYCNALLAELLASTLTPLQLVMHTPARLVFGLSPKDHVSSDLSVKQRIESKLCLLVHQTFNGRAPQGPGLKRQRRYLTELGTALLATMTLLLGGRD